MTKSLSGAKRFKTLRGTRVAYSCFFHDDSANIDAALACLDLDALALLRNLIAHKLSIPDDFFRREAKGIPRVQKWCNADLDFVELRGEDVRDIVVSGYQATAKVITATDEWLKAKSYGQGSFIS